MDKIFVGESNDVSGSMNSIRFPLHHGITIWVFAASLYFSNLKFSPETEYTLHSNVTRVTKMCRYHEPILF